MVEQVIWTLCRHSLMICYSKCGPWSSSMGRPREVLASVVHGLASLTSLGSFIEMQYLGPHPQAY